MRLVSLTELIQWFEEETMTIMVPPPVEGSAHEGEVVREIDARSAS